MSYRRAASPGVFTPRGGEQETEQHVNKGIYNMDTQAPLPHGNGSRRSGLRCSEADIEYGLFTVSHILTALQMCPGRSSHVYILKNKSTKCLKSHRPPRGLKSAGRWAPVASPADVPARVPHFCARLHLQHVEEGMLEGFGQGDALGRLVLQHALDEVEKAVVVLGLRVQVALGRGRGQVQPGTPRPVPSVPSLAEPVCSNHR